VHHRAFPWRIVRRTFSIAATLALATSVAGSLGVGSEAPASAATLPSSTPDWSLAPDGALAPPSPMVYGAKVLGQATAGAPVHMTLYFTPRDQQALRADAEQAHRAGRAGGGRFLTVAQFRRRFAPEASTVSRINGYLKAAGWRVDALGSNGMEETAAATAAQTGAALHVAVRQVRTRTGSDVLGVTGIPVLPAYVAQNVSFIDGLSPWVTPTSNVRLPKGSPRAAVTPGMGAAARPAAVANAGVTECSQMSQMATSQEMLDPNHLASDYKLTGFYSKNDTAAYKVVALIEYSSTDTAGVNAFASCLGLHPSITYNNDPNDNPGNNPSIEADVDVEDVLGLAPGASVVVEQSGNGPFANTLDPWTMAVSPPASALLPDVISSSWGECEPATQSASQSTYGSPTAYFQAEENLMAEAALQGQTVVVASGDSGSTGCYGQVSDQTVEDGLYVDSPASDPLVTAIGGTANSYGAQVVWNHSDSGCNDLCDINGGTGGGLSAAFSQPSYQPSAPSLQTGCSLSSGGCREVPDVSAIAGDGYLMTCSTAISDCPNGGTPGDYFFEVGGTSLAAPSWAATAALADTACGVDVGFLNPILYDNTNAGHPVVGHITTGDNDYEKVNSGQYPAYASGTQNLATGLGYLGGVDLSGGVLCQDYATPAPASGPYTPVSPTRICDTRGGNPSHLTGVAAQCDGLTPRTGRSLTMQVIDPSFNVPAGATAVVLNVTAVAPSVDGYLTVYPTGSSKPFASNVNFTTGKVVPNLVEVGVGTYGRVSVFASVKTDVVVDLEGYVSGVGPSGAGSGLYEPLSAPTRICDTRGGNPSGLSGLAAQCEGKSLGVGQTLTVTVGDAASDFGVPASAAAVVLNVTAVNDQAGYLTVFPGGSSRPTASNVNMSPGLVVANRVMVPLGAGGQIQVYASNRTDVVIDLAGYYTAAGGSGAQFEAEPAPVRVCDTRPGNPSHLSGSAAQCDGTNNGGETLSTGSVLTVNVAGAFNVPAGAAAVVLNVTGVSPSAASTYLTVYPGGSRPTASDINLTKGAVVPNLVVATVSPSGTVSIFNYAGSTNVVVDVAGWYQ
jgi:hypothetical protein